MLLDGSSFEGPNLPRLDFSEGRCSESWEIIMTCNVPSQPHVFAASHRELRFELRSLGSCIPVGRTQRKRPSGVNDMQWFAPQSFVTSQV